MSCRADVPACEGGDASLVGARSHPNADRVAGHIWAGEHWTPYTGGRIYDPTHPTGGHFDHIHVSVRR